MRSANHHVGLWAVGHELGPLEHPPEFSTDADLRSSDLRLRASEPCDG